MQQLRDLLTEVSGMLRDAGIESPRREARLIVEAATGLDASRQLADPERLVETSTALALAARRVRREPMAYLQGHREFWGLDFAVGQGALVPRPESETLIEAVLDRRPDRLAALKIADLGTGTGCIVLTLLTLYPAAIGIGIDRSAAALAWARANRQRLGLDDRAFLIRADWLTATPGPFDLIVANPPYIASDDARDVETAHEPEGALLAGADGLDAYRAIAGPAHAALAPGGMVVLEIGAGQAPAVSALLEAAGLSDIRLIHDLAGRPRCLVGQKGLASRR